MEKIIAYCGLVCNECPAYMATQADDAAALERVAAQWREQFNSPDITAESVICDGCLGSDDARLAGYCSMCEIRACGVARSVANCAYCADYACDKLESFFVHASNAQQVLEEIRSGFAR
jgi:thiamine biosynthesis protein ThiC